tara:strand:+ start:4156 stop:5142 length:987 start_codon:yes stop_codon:yes gene_type:complete
MSLIDFPRQIGLKRTRCFSRTDFETYITRFNGKTDIYTSLYSFDDPYDYDTVVIDRAWWDFDMTEEFDMETVKQDVATLIRRLDGDVRLVATGRGFHVHQIFKRAVRGREWALHLDRYEREMADGLKSLDGVGYPEKLTRVSMTFNRKRGRWAVPIPAGSFSNSPQDYKIPNAPDRTMKVIDPFVGTINYEECFDLVIWNADNPFREKPTEGGYMTVMVGSHEGEVNLPTCLNRAIRVSNPAHHVRVALVQHMAQQLRWFADPTELPHEEKMAIAQTICEFIISLEWQDYNHAITSKYVRGMMDYKNAPSPAWFRKHNLCTGGCWYCD